VANYKQKADRETREGNSEQNIGESEGDQQPEVTIRCLNVQKSEVPRILLQAAPFYSRCTALSHLSLSYQFSNTHT